MGDAFCHRPRNMGTARPARRGIARPVCLKEHLALVLHQQCMGFAMCCHGRDEWLTKSLRFPHLFSLDAVTLGRNRARSETQQQFPH